MTDEAKALVERLRKARVWPDYSQSRVTIETAHQAADTIEAQAREIARLREALKELVEEYVRNVDCTRLGDFYLDPETEDCVLAARAALEGTNND